MQVAKYICCLLLAAVAATGAPAETVGWLPSPSLSGAAPIPSEFDPTAQLIPTWGDGKIPPSMYPDDVGAFRFVCGPGQILADDPIVYPGQPGKSHWHQFYGNLGANAYSTFESLRTTGQTTCGDPKKHPLNRSGYWIAAMLDGKGNFVQPDWAGVYYKRIPSKDPRVSDPKRPHYMGKAIALPNGLRFIFGYDMLKGAPAPAGFYINCAGKTATPGHYKSIPEAMPNCPVGNQLGIVLNSQDCWDGKHLDSPDHRSHVAYSDYVKGYLSCPAGFPYVIPRFLLGVWYTVAPGDDLSKWHLASDEMHPELPAGSTAHADWFGAWDPQIMATWTANCIEKQLSCTGGDLGNGKQMPGAQMPPTPQHLVRIPKVQAHDIHG